MPSLLVTNLSQRCVVARVDALLVVVFVVVVVVLVIVVFSHHASQAKLGTDECMFLFSQAKQWPADWKKGLKGSAVDEL